MTVTKDHNVHVAKNLGVDPDRLKKDMSPEEVDRLVEKKIGKQLKHSHKFGGRIPRGNPLIALGRFLDKKVITKFDRLFSK
jgi:hypothetical protein